MEQLINGDSIVGPLCSLTSGGRAIKAEQISTYTRRYYPESRARAAAYSARFVDLCVLYLHYTRCVSPASSTRWRERNRVHKFREYRYLSAAAAHISIGIERRTETRASLYTRHRIRPQRLHNPLQRWQ